MAIFHFLLCIPLKKVSVSLSLEPPFVKQLPNPIKSRHLGDSVLKHRSCEINLVWVFPFIWRQWQSMTCKNKKWPGNIGLKNLVMISSYSVLEMIGEESRAERGSLGRRRLNHYFTETPGDKTKVKEQWRKIQPEVTITLKVVPAAMRARHSYAWWKTKINQWEWTRDTKKTQHAATIGHDCTISGGEERVKKADVRPTFKSSHSKPSK